MSERPKPDDSASDPKEAGYPTYKVCTCLQERPEPRTEITRYVMINGWQHRTICPIAKKYAT